MKKIFLILMPLLIIAGCGSNIFEGVDNKSSKEASALDVTKRLDGRDYNAILNDPNANPLDYAAAAMGKAGIDPVELINKLNNLSSSSTKNDLGSVASLNLNPDPAALGALQTAKNKLNEALAPPNQYDPDLNFQMVVTSVTSTLIAVAQVGKNIPGVTVTDGITKAEGQDIATYIIKNPTVTVDTNGTNPELVTVVAGDIANVISSLPSAKLGTSLNTVLSDVATSPTGINFGCTAVDGKCTSTVTATNISNYLNNNFGNQ